MGRLVGTLPDWAHPTSTGGLPMTETDRPGFQRDIRPLFRDRDLRSMSFAFDLASFDDVRSHADLIARRTAAGEMPCDAPWSKERVQLFRAWIDGGFEP